MNSAVALRLSFGIPEFFLLSSLTGTGDTFPKLFFFLLSVSLWACSRVGGI